MNTATMWTHRKTFADICRRARPGGDWCGYKPVAFESKKTDTQWYFLDLPWAYVVCFRGTEPNKAKDIITDLMIRKKVIPYGNKRSKIRVHRGFLRAYKSVREQVHAAILNYVTERKPIVVTGHSLGGALATLCAIDLQYNMGVFGGLNKHGRAIHVFTYGSPRVGNRAFCRSYRIRCGRTWRFWGLWDIVAKIPPVLFGYSHVTTGFRLNTRHAIQGYIKRLDPKR